MDDANASNAGSPGESVPDTASDPPHEGRFTAEILAALAYGEQLGADRAQQNVTLAPDARSRSEQQHIAGLERQNWELVAARVRELNGEGFIEPVRPFFDAFFADTQPTDWIEAILASRCSKKAIPIYQGRIPSRRLTRRPFGR